MEHEALSKHEIAEFLANLFPELKPQLPPKKKAWMSESLRINMFNAVSLAYVVMQRKEIQSEEVTV